MRGPYSLTTTGSAYTNKKITLKQGVDAWQKHLKEHGKQQGFNIY